MGGGHIQRRRAEGKLDNLVKALGDDWLPGKAGIAHTRWATHGAPTTSNAHPHATPEVSLVHNGIIENFKELREELQAHGRTFESQTDTEVAAHLISRAHDGAATREQAVSRSFKRLPGAFPLSIRFRQQPALARAQRGGGGGLYEQL